MNPVNQATINPTKYRAITVEPVENGHQLQHFTGSMEQINEWSHVVSKKYSVDVKIYESYERVVTIVRKPYNKQCQHDRLDEDGICLACGADKRGIGE